jgi:hypothetical protein
MTITPEGVSTVAVILLAGSETLSLLPIVKSNLAEMRTELQHLTKLAETHGRERSHMGERVGTLERAVPEKLTERLSRLETRIGQFMVLGSLLTVLWPVILAEIRRPEAAPSHVRVVVPTRQGP